MATNKVYLYPKTSCDCTNCDTSPYKDSSESPTNMSVNSCSFPEQFNCTNRLYMGAKSGKVSGTKNIAINPQVYTDSVAKGFERLSCNGQYASWDPRLWNATHNQYTTFSQPPIDGNVQLKDVYNDDLKGYGQNYKTYSDINSGQIIYYTDPDLNAPYYEPLFDDQTYGKILFRTPMGGIKPEYPRVVNYSNPMTDTTTNFSPCGLSWMRDTQQFRQDILTGYTVKMNQQRWQPRWN